MTLRMRCVGGHASAEGCVEALQCSAGVLRAPPTRRAATLPLVSPRQGARASLVCRRRAQASPPVPQQRWVVVHSGDVQAATNPAELPTRELKKLLVSAGVDVSNFFEKRDLIERWAALPMEQQHAALLANIQKLEAQVEAETKAGAEKKPVSTPPSQQASSAAPQPTDEVGLLRSRLAKALLEKGLSSACVVSSLLFLEILRDRGIPARAVQGYLVIGQPAVCCAFHVWVESGGRVYDVGHEITLLSVAASGRDASSISTVFYSPVVLPTLIRLDMETEAERTQTAALEASWRCIDQGDLERSYWDDAPFVIKQLRSAIRSTFAKKESKGFGR